VLLVEGHSAGAPIVHAFVQQAADPEAPLHAPFEHVEEEDL
jgi:hypothetical protein